VSTIVLCAGRNPLQTQAIGHSNYFVGRLFAWLIGLKEPNFLVAYSGNEQDLALGRGELDARINNADTLTRRNADLLAKNLINDHAIMEVPRGLKPAGFENLPEIEGFAKTDRERKLVCMVRDFRQVGSPYILPPGTPKEAVKILQEAMVKVLKDPDSRRTISSSSAKSRLPSCPKSWKDSSKIYRAILRSSRCSRRSTTLVRCRFAKKPGIFLSTQQFIPI
jgi:hypothetical protein